MPVYFFRIYIIVYNIIIPIPSRSSGYSRCGLSRTVVLVVVLPVIRECVCTYPTPQITTVVPILYRLYHDISLLLLLYFFYLLFIIIVIIIMHGSVRAAVPVGGRPGVKTKAAATIIGSECIRSMAATHIHAHIYRQR